MKFRLIQKIKHFSFIWSWFFLTIRFYFEYFVSGLLHIEIFKLKWSLKCLSLAFYRVFSVLCVYFTFDWEMYSDLALLFIYFSFNFTYTQAHTHNAHIFSFQLGHCISSLNVRVFVMFTIISSCYDCSFSQ